jgi:putative transposase
VARLYRIEGLSLREKTHKRRKSANVRQPRTVVTAPNQVWSLDFMHDRLADEAHRAYRLLTIVDVHTRERLALEPAFAFRAIDVITVLNKIIAKRGCGPQSIRCDNGTEFTATAFDQWAYANDIVIDYSRPGKRPTMPLSSRSTAGFGKSYSTELGSRPSKRSDARAAYGVVTTTRIVHIDR